MLIVWGSFKKKTDDKLALVAGVITRGNILSLETGIIGIFFSI